MTATTGVGINSAMASAILAQPPSPSDATRSFRLARFQALPPERQIEFETRFDTPTIGTSYAQTECIPVTQPEYVPVSQDREADLRLRRSVGRPAEDFEVRLVDEFDEPVGTGQVGEIVVRPRRPEVMFSGYWRKPEATQMEAEIVQLQSNQPSACTGCTTSPPGTAS